MDRPAVGRRGCVCRAVREVASDEDVHHRHRYSQDPTLQLAQPNVFRYYGDGAQWNAGTGEIAYKRLKWRNAAIIMDDYSFGWTSAAGPHRRLLRDRRQDHEAGLPAAEHDRLLVVSSKLPAPDSVDGYFWVVGGTGTSASLKAFEQTYGALKPSQHIGNLFFAFLGADKVVAPKVVGSRRRLRHRSRPQDAVGKAYEAVAKHYPGLNGGNYADGFVYNYYNAAWALVQGLTKSGGQLGKSLQSALPRTLKPGYQVTNNGVLRLDRTGRRSRISTAAGRPQREHDRDGRRRLRAERRPVLRRPLQEDEPAAWPHAAACVKKKTPGRARSRSSRTASSPTRP